MKKPTTPKRGFRCATCGERHDELLTDIGFQLPDDVYALDYVERYRRARYNTDFCTLDRTRHFVRCVLPVPFTYRDDFFGWGVWMEISKKHHELTLARFENDADSVPAFAGTVANRIRGYRSTLGLKASVKLADDHRPLVTLLPDQKHRLVREQRDGIDAERHHELAARHA